MTTVEPNSKPKPCLVSILAPICSLNPMGTKIAKSSGRTREAKVANPCNFIVRNRRPASWMHHTARLKPPRSSAILRFSLWFCRCTLKETNCKPKSWPECSQRRWAMNARIMSSGVLPKTDWHSAAKKTGRPLYSLISAAMNSAPLT